MPASEALQKFVELLIEIDVQFIFIYWADVIHSDVHTIQKPVR